MESEKNCNFELTLPTNYMEEVVEIVENKFDEKKVQNFTAKWLEKQLNGPQINEKFDENELDKLQKMSAGEVQDALLSKSLKYSDVVKMYQYLKARGKNSHKELTWSLFAKPLARAQELEKSISKMDPAEAREKWPLAGFVMSIKDSIYMKDTPNTSGLFINLDRVATHQSELVRTLIENGAVITSKGNIPQLLFSAECGNNIYGEGLNPYDKTRTPGGSSGGEAALIAMGFNNAAIGTDVGGSVRIPALFCGIAALKPTSQRVSIKAQGKWFDRRFGSQRRPQKVKSKYDFQFIIPTCLGPMARTVGDLEKLMRVMVRNQSFDRSIAPLPWRENVKFYKKVGVFKGSPLVELGPTAKRALDEAIQALLEAKYEVIELDIESLFDEIIVNSLLAYNKNRCLQSILYGGTKIKEPLFPLYDLVKSLYSAPILAIRFIKSRETEIRKKMMLRAYLNARSISQQDLMLIKNELYYRLLAKMDEQGISAILAPGTPMPAFKLKLSNKCLMANCYTFAWNFVDVPVGVVKVCNVRQDEQFYESKYDDEMTADLKENAKDSKGMPMGVSVVGKVFQEEIVLKVLKDIEDNLGKII